MANGDIPVSGSAQSAAGTFRINAVGGNKDDLDHLLVRTRGQDLHISVNNGAGARFEAILVSPDWRFEIRERRASD